MSGIPIVSGDVTLAGDPNAFTGTNTYNVNRPTSTLTNTGSTNLNDFITKRDGNALYSGIGSGDVTQAGNNVFTGTNTFNSNRPTSTITTTIADTDFITKQNADTLYNNNAGDVTKAGSNVFTGTNTFNSNRPTSTLQTTIADTDFITKQNADTLYNNNAGDVTKAGSNVFTGTNTFNSNRPTSTLQTTIADTDFITKQNADTLYNNNAGDVTKAGSNVFTGTNTFNSNRPTSTLQTAIADTDFITKQNADTLYTNNTGVVTIAGTQDITGSKTFKSGTHINITDATANVFTAKNTLNGNGFFKQNFGSGQVNLAYGNPKLGIAQFRTTQGAYEPIISVMNSNTGGVSTSKQSSIGFYATDSVGAGKYQGSLGFYPNENVTTSDFKINQVLGDVALPTEIFTIKGDAQTTFVFKGQGQYPHINFKGTGDANECLELGRDNANGSGYLRLGNQANNDNGIILRGGAYSHINGGNLGIGTGSSTPSEKLEVVGNIKTTNGEVKIPNAYANNFTLTNFSVFAGNPTSSQVRNNSFNGNLDTYLYESITTQVANQKILINCVVNGEWTSQSENKGLALGVQVGSSSATRDIERPPQVSASARGRFLTTFTQSYHNDAGSTLEVATLSYVYFASSVNTYHFFPILVNTGTAASTFHLNGTITSSNNIYREIAGSYMNLQLLST